MWRTKKWKLILFIDKTLNEAKLASEQMKGELYDLEADPHEWKNLYKDDKYHKIREQLKTELLENLAVTYSGYPMGKG